jgi:uncharacterized protein (DUF697 family)
MAAMISKSKALYKLIDKALSTRVLSKLSDEKRDELLDHAHVIRRMLAEQRSPRVAVLGHVDHSLPGLVKTILGESVEGDLTVKEKLGRRRWYDYEGEVGALRLLDLRTEPGESLPTPALAREQTDLVILAWKPGDDFLIEHLEEAVRQTQGAWAATPTVVAAIVKPEGGTFHPGQAERSLRHALVESTIPNESFSVVLRDEESVFVETLIDEAPMEVQVRLAHLTWARDAKREVAENVIRAAAGIAGTIATVPLPVADIAPITSVQIVMVAAIAHLSGREFNVRTATEFAVAMGANIGVGYAIREALRAWAQLIPVAGSVLSAGIATSATYAIGRAATAYFIGEEKSYYGA